MATLVQLSSRTTTRTKRDEAATSAEKRIKPASQVGKKLKMCLYARNKVGKTKFACASNLRTLVIDCNEKGYDSVSDQDNVDIYEVRSWEDLDPIYWLLRAGNHPYEVVVIDTVTMLAAVGMKWVLHDDFERDMNRDPMTPNRQSYLKLGEMLKDAIIKFRNLPYHIIFNAQEKTSTSEEDDEGNTTSETHPELSPAPRSVLLSATNLIGRLYIREVEVKGKKRMQRRMLVGPYPKYVSGGRFPQLKTIEVNPTLAGFLEKIYGGTSAEGSSTS